VTQKDDIAINSLHPLY